MFVRRSLAMLLCALILSAVSMTRLAADDSSPARGRRVVRPEPGRPVVGDAAPPVPAQQPVPPQLTQIQIDIFEVTFASEQLHTFAPSRLPREDADSRKQMLARLEELGETKVLVLTDNVIDISKESELKHRRNTPVVRGLAAGPSSKTMRSVEYRNVGFTASVRGDWNQETGPATGCLSCDITLSDVVPSGVSRGDGGSFPAFVRLEIKKAFPIESGKAVVFIGNEAAASTDPSRVRSHIIRVKATRLTDLEPAGDPPSNETVQATHVRIDCYQLACDAQRLIEIGPLLERSSDATANDLARLGDVRTVGFMDTITDLRKGASLTNGSNTPLVTGAVVGRTGKTTPNVTYRDVGFKVDLEGQWRPASSGDVLNLRCRCDFSDATRSPIRLSEDMPALPEYPNFSISQSLALSEGEPVYIVKTALPVSEQEDTTGSAIILRIEARRAPGCGIQLDGQRADSARRLSRFQVELYELICHSGVGSPSVRDLQPHAETSASFVKRLETMGSVTLLGTIDDISDLSGAMNYAKEQDVPVVTDITVDKKDSVIPSVNYKNVGLKILLQGEWHAGSPALADLVCSLNYVGVSKSGVETAQKVELPSYIEFKANQRMTLLEGKPIVMVSRGLAGPDAPSDRPTIHLVRVVAVPLETADDAAAAH